MQYMSLFMSKFMSFDKHTIARVQYILDEHYNYVKKAGHEEQKHFEIGKHEEEAQEQHISDPPPTLVAFDTQVTFQAMMVEIASLRTIILKHLDDIERRMDLMKKRDKRGVQV